jgi:hypothetical protein
MDGVKKVSERLSEVFGEPPRYSFKLYREVSGSVIDPVTTFLGVYSSALGVRPSKHSRKSSLDDKALSLDFRVSTATSL